MRIKCLSLFKDGHRVFEKDDVVTVSDKDGAVYVAHGWACEEGKEPPEVDQTAKATDLNVQNSTLGTSSKVV